MGSSTRLIEDYYVVGGGMSGIVTALRMQRKGFRVTLISDQPNPNKNKKRKRASWSGSSWGGGPTRMISPREGDVYLGSTEVYPDMIGRFERTVAQGGWLNKADLSPKEQSWIDKRRKADSDGEYVNRLRGFYQQANSIGMAGWERLLDKHLVTDQSPPERLKKMTHFRSGIVRMFDTQAKVNMGVEFYSQKGLLDSVYFANSNQFKEEFPFLSADDGVVAALKIKGYSINHNKFMKLAFRHLVSEGAIVKFNTSVTEIVRDGCGRVSAFVLNELNPGSPDVPKESRIENPKYGSIHIGAYDTHGILRDTPAENTIMAVSGLWAQMSLPQGMKNSMKVHIGEGNGIPLTDVNAIMTASNGAGCLNALMVGGGYVFTGENPNDITEASREVTYEAIERAVHRAFNDSAALDSFSRLQNIMCSRSFTHDDLPRFDVMETVGGRIVIWGGDNTGTVSIAPAAAHIVESLVTGRDPYTAESKAFVNEAHHLRARSDEILQANGQPVDLFVTNDESSLGPDAGGSSSISPAI